MNLTEAALFATVQESLNTPPGFQSSPTTPETPYGILGAIPQRFFINSTQTPDTNRYIIQGLHPVPYFVREPRKTHLS
jgi:hypothetical protein